MRKYFVLTVCVLYPLFASAQIPERLVGIWLVDPKATEDYLNKVEPPPMEKRGWMGGTLMFQFGSTMTINNGTLSIRSLGYQAPSTTYQLSPLQADGLEFELSKDGTKDRIAVTFINDRNIVIKSTKVDYPRMEFIEYAVWKRSESADPHPKSYEEATKAVQQAIADFQAMVKNVPFLNCLAPQRLRLDRACHDLNRLLDEPGP